MTAILGVALPLAALLAGCGEAARSDSPSALGPTWVAAGKPAASPSGSARSDVLAGFAECMREHGMTWFPDPPEPGQEQDIELPSNVSEDDFEAAQQACRQLARDIVKGPAPNAADVESLRQMARCMRENGVPDFPDPDADGSLMLDTDTLSIKTNDPIFKAAEKACEQGPEGGSTR